MSFQKPLSRSGLTLIELVVVLLILAALAGILVPYAVGFLQRSHGASGASNISEITTAIVRYEVETGSQPTGFDSLVEPGTNSAYYGLDITGGELNAPADINTLDLGGDTDAALDALTNAGITTLAVMKTDAASNDATFDAGTGATAAITDATFVMTADGAAVNRELGAPAAALYVAFGLGSQVSAIGKTMVGAPVHALDGETPVEVYARWIVIYQVSDENGTTNLSKAKFVGVIANEEGVLSGLGGHLAEYHESTE